MIGEEFVTGEAGEEVETLGGYLVAHVGRLPVRGEVISGPGNFEIEVLDADPRRVKRLRIAVRKERPRRARRAKAAAAKPRPMPARRRPTTMRRRRPAMEPARSEAHQQTPRRRSFDHPGLGLEARGHRAGRGRAVGAGDGAVQCLAGAVPDLSGRGLADRRRRRPDSWRGVPAAAMSGCWFGLGYFVPGLYWIGYAFLVDAPTFAWLMPFAVLGLPAYLALFTALGFALARLIWTRDASRVLALAVSLTVSEWLRGHVLTGFPWNAFGYALTEPLALAQTASLIGLWGMTFLARRDLRQPGRADRRNFARPKALDRAGGGAAAAGRDGRFRRRAAVAAADRDGRKVKLRIMQPNLQQDVKFNYAAKAEVMQKYLTLSDRASGPQSTGVRDASILIWPESAFPFFLTREADAMAQIAELLPKGTVLITGSVRAPDVPPGARVTRAYNSIYVIDHDGSVLSVYDKLHLVPFGEYLPFQDVDGKARLRAADQGAGRLHSGHAAPRDGDPECAARAAADLLRGDFSRRCCRARRSPRLDHQPDQ